MRKFDQYYSISEKSVSLSVLKIIGWLVRGVILFIVLFTAYKQFIG